VFGYAIAEGRRAKCFAGMPPCAQSWTTTLLQRNEQHESLPTLGRPAAPV
jgi:hypothetical protein